MTSIEIVLWGDLRPLAGMTRPEARFAAQVWLSVAWAAYAASLVAIGFARRAAELRWAGIVVFGITLVKVFLHDMRDLDAVYRIGSFLALGTLLVAASFLYQRRR